ncbi:MAG: bifunctional proline dehydrogenase/L-glutamate gamma-semialdehyde dehydrogenase PutA [Hyphomicrobiales bacterium]
MARASNQLSDKPGPDRSAISSHLLAAEADIVPGLIENARSDGAETARIEQLARRLVNAVRKGRRPKGGVDAFMQEYDLSSEEGVMLMCLAEALLRIPDADTADKLIADKISGRDWEEHMGASDSLFVNVSTWGLMLTGKVIELGGPKLTDAYDYLGNLVKKSGEPIIRQAMRHAMRIMGKQFVLGRTIEEALELAAFNEEMGYRHSYDMLGEAAMTADDAARYHEAYKEAVSTVAADAGAMGSGNIFKRPSISVKLSALHPRYEPAKAERMENELLPRVLELALMAKEGELGLTIDAEEAERLELSLSVFARLAEAPELKNWNGLGLAVQGYGRRAYPVLEWLDALAHETGRRLPVRLVKGAYWDTEIKHGQEQGLDSYPVFTRKVLTDVSYLACAKQMLAHDEAIYPQFATHNAHSLAAILTFAGNRRDFEFQRLHGMGQSLYEEVVGADKENVACRIYAPVGSHEDLLAYLVRRLLENGANTSFVNRLADDEAPISKIIANPVERAEALESIPHPAIPAPADIFSPRRNSRGEPLWDDETRNALCAEIEKELKVGYHAAPIVDGRQVDRKAQTSYSPHDRKVPVGKVAEATPKDIETAVSSAANSSHDWDRLGGEARAEILERVADLYEQNTARLMGIMVREAGKTLNNAQADLREAVDFLRYYAAQAREKFSSSRQLPGPTGERNEVSLHGRGVFACIAPWNFPLAIFTGQVAAALAAGNAAIAKPAEQTPLTAFEAISLMHKAGVPGEALHLIPGSGAVVGAALVADSRVGGIAFTGSNETANAINQALAARGGAIVPFIAETGGINAMIVDSTALPEQAVRDLIGSAYDSAGQRCSAARVAFVQDDIAQRFVPMLQGAVEELKLGDPLDFATDVGPVIDEEARARLDDHKATMARQARTLIDLPLPPEIRGGVYVSPAVYEIEGIEVLEQEVFGPILHVVRYQADRLEQVCDAINSTGFGLTLGVHTRIETTAEEIRERVRVGNMYVNRNQIGAVVGAQPFGGEGLSGTGPKAGGPHYLARFATERVVSIDTTASGGNASLMSMEISA